MISLHLLLGISMFSYAYENIALYKPAWQLSQHIPGDNRFNASNAVDGLKSDLDWSGGQCVISANLRRTATWRVDLEDTVNIHHITIYYRTANIPWGSTSEHSGRFLGFSLYVSNTTDRTQGKLCFHDTNYTRATIPAVLNVTCPVHGRYVIYYNERLPGVTYPSGYSTYAFNDLCEVEVYGCPGFYGVNCSLPCPDVNCRHCHIETGACQGCNPGYQGHRCQLTCNNRKYGQECGLDCGACLNLEQCHHVTGICLKGCDPGFKRGLCKEECGEKKYGPDCNQICGKCREDKQCHHINGSCNGECEPGYQGTRCDAVCEVGYFGASCREECSIFCQKSRDCHHVTGECRNGCKSGWRGHNCSEACNNKKYGQDCGLDCGACLNLEQCNHVTGTCLKGCDPGFKGGLCKEECGEKKYGPDCNQICGKCREDKQCHHINGSCNGECEPGYQGTRCDTICEVGYFGASCREECSIFCQKARDCHHVTGECRNGCKSGWRGHKCSEVDYQVKGEESGNNWKTRFYGVFGAFCTTLVVVGVLIFLLYKSSKRSQMNSDIIKKYRKNNPPSSSKETVSQVHTDEYVNSGWQELGELSPSSIYESIH